MNYKDKILQYDNDYHLSKFEKMSKENQFWKLKSIIAKREYFNYDFDEDSKVFEFGCGVGQNLGQIKNAYAYDINKGLYPELKAKGITMYDSMDEVPDNFFDEIIISQVLEHVPKPLETLELLHKKLKIGGKIRVVVPRAWYRYTDLNESPDGHLHCWTFNELNYLLKYAGFNPLYNRNVYRRGTERFFIFSKLGVAVYRFVTVLVGYLTRDFDLLAIARKEI